MTWFFYAFAAAVIWGINYAVAGRLLERGMSPQTLFFIDMVFGAVGMALLLSVGAPFWQDTLESLFGLKNLLRKRSDTRNVEEEKGGQPKP